MDLTVCRIVNFDHIVLDWLKIWKAHSWYEKHIYFAINQKHKYQNDMNFVLFTVYSSNLTVLNVLKNERLMNQVYFVFVNEDTKFSLYKYALLIRR